MSEKCPEPVVMPDGSVSILNCRVYLDKKYGDKRDTPREFEVAKLWGFSADDFNEKEVFIDRFKFRRETVKPFQIKGAYSYCKIHLAQAPNGYWAVSSSVNLSTTGYGSSPSIWNCTQYPDKQSAINAEIDIIIKYCSKTKDRLAEKMLKIATEFKKEQNTMKHPDLFG